MKITNKYLFNFAASRSGGGFKRLTEYAKWFNGNGGAWFVIHPSCKDMIDKFPKNQYFLANISRFKRVFDDCSYLSAIKDKIGKPDLYYSYGIPVYYRFGKVNWFHLSNILPLYSEGISISLFDKFIRYTILRHKIKKNYKNADIISAESKNSLTFIDVDESEKLFLSVNGSDDELQLLKNKSMLKKKCIATVIGTQPYKGLIDSLRVFDMLRKKSNDLELIVIGSEKQVPNELLLNKNVTLTGVINQKDVIRYLKKTKYYISSTCIENSFNAASEGIFFAEESFISDIGPHRELLMNEKYEYIPISHIKKPMIHVKRDNIVGKNLKSWNDVIADVIKTASSF